MRKYDALFAGDWESFGNNMMEVVDAFQPAVKGTKEDYKD